MKTATEPLTPRSAMPAKRKAAVPLKGHQPANKTSTELAHLEKQNPKATNPKSGSRKTIEPRKSAESSSGGSGIDYKYQKPAGGKTAASPSSKGPATPRVKPH